MHARLLLVPVVCLFATLNAYAAGGKAIEKALDSSTDLEFKRANLRDVATYISEIHDIKVELDPAVDGNTKTGMKINNKKLRDALTEFLKPLDLEFVAEEDRLLIRKIAKKTAIANAAISADKTTVP